MFLVTDGFGIFTVYSVRDNNGKQEFLLFTNEGWEWSSANHYRPYFNEDEQSDKGDQGCKNDMKNVIWDLIEEMADGIIDIKQISYK